MKLLAIEGDFTGLFILILAIMFGPALIFTFMGAYFRKKNIKTAKVFFILAVVYLIISFGICGSMMM